MQSCPMPETDPGVPGSPVRPPPRPQRDLCPSDPTGAGDPDPPGDAQRPVSLCADPFE